MLDVDTLVPIGTVNTKGAPAHRGEELLLNIDLETAVKLVGALLCVNVDFL